MNIGFTGSRKGPTPEQAHCLHEYLKAMIDVVKVESFHHGCAIGADEVAAIYVHTIRGAFDHPLIVGHPCNLIPQTSDFALELSDEKHPVAPPLERNRDIVRLTDILLACPSGMAEELRSGTWATIRHAKRFNKPVMMFWPDGTKEEVKP